MKQLGLGIIVAIGLTLPALAQETERAQLAEGIYMIYAQRGEIDSNSRNFAAGSIRQS
jgi:hypothetical protein